MAQNSESAADGRPRQDSSAPGLEGEGGQYTEDDYGDAGSVEAPADAPADREYPDGDTGDTETSGTAREVEVDEGKSS